MADAVQKLLKFTKIADSEIFLKKITPLRKIFHIAVLLSTTESSGIVIARSAATRQSRK
ncbi:MAG: hypothetical protein LBF54_02430 [Holosporaceae bacterium]|nr:hypothetical protein [Holosporaceae bacterium]